MQTETAKQVKFNRRVLPDGLEFRLGTVEDVPALVEMGKEFFALSQMGQLGAEFSEQQTEKYLTAAIGNGFMHHLLATVDGVIVGGVSFYYDCAFYVKPLAILNHFFVTKKYRRTLVGRMLIKMAEDIARDEQACSFVAPVNSGSPHIHSLGNLLAKNGFVMSGYIMSRSL